MSLLLDKYKPNAFDDFIVNKNIAHKLKLYCKSGMFLNKIIVGGNSVGKYTIAMAILNEYFGPDVYKKKNVEYKLKIGTNTKEFTITQSSYHFEIFINNYLFNDRISLIKLLNILTEYKNIKTNSYNVILIKNIDQVSHSVIPSLKNLMETNIDTCRFIFISRNNSKFRKILPMLYVIRVPKIETHEIIDFLNKKQIKYNKDNIKDNNLIRILLNIELKNITNKNYKYSIDTEMEQIIKLLNKKDTNQFIKIREHIYTYISKNFSKDALFSYICNYYIKSDINDNSKFKIIELSALFERRLANSYREMIHIEGYLMNILNVLINN